MNSLPIVDVYVFRMPDTFEISRVLPIERQNEIEGIKNEQVKKQKYYSWKVLEYGLSRTFGYAIDKIDLKKTKYGKWISDFCYISISHSNNMVVVGISSNPIGVDVELVRKTRNKAIEKALVEDEKKLLEKVETQEKDRFLISTWSKKESLFKKEGDGVFAPSKTNTTKADFFETFIKDNDDEYVVSASSDFCSCIRVFNEVNID